MIEPGTTCNGELPTSTDTVIIGAGIVGIATAWFLSRNGHRPIVIDAAAGPGTRTTAMSAHCIRAQFSEPDSIAMMAESLDFYESFAERIGPGPANASIGLVQQGYLFASTDEDDIPAFEERVALQRSLGLDDVELLDGDEVRYRFPWLASDIVTATFRGRDGWIDSALAVAAMARAAGCPIHLNTMVTAIECGNDRVKAVRTNRGRIACDRIVLAAGPFSGAISPEPLPLSPVRRHRVIVRPSAGIPQSGPVTIDANTGAHWRPHQGGALMAWAQDEAPGDAVWPVPVDPAFVDLVLHGDRGVGRLSPFWHDLSPTLTANDIILTAGQYTITPDHRPLIGAARQTAGLFLNTGYSGHGIMGAPAGARLLAGIMSDTESAANPFSPARDFAGAASHRSERMVI